MKTILYTLIIAASLALTSNPARAQAWERNSRVLSLGFGVSKYFHVDDYYYYNHENPKNPHGWYWPETGQLTFQGEFGIHKYVGLGFIIGIGGRGGMAHNYTGELNVPIGMIANFHFYQLIADKRSRNIHADKLDIYAGASAGSGLAFTYYEDPDKTSRMVPIAFGGLHVGIRYYFTDKVGVNGEFGWGKNLINVGFAFKI